MPPVDPTAGRRDWLCRLLARGLASPRVGWSAPAQAGFVAGHLRMRAAAVAVFAWGLVTGVAMAKSGLPLPLVFALSALMFAGAAQLAAVPLLVAGFPIRVACFAAAVVNLRFLITSAGLHPFFSGLPGPRRVLIGYLNGDITYLMFIGQYPQPTRGAQVEGFYFGLALTNMVCWHLGSFIGIVGAAAIPPAWELDFAGTLALLALLVPQLATRAGAWVAGAAAVAAVATAALPFRLNLVVAVLVAVVAGVIGDEAAAGRALERRR